VALGVSGDRTVVVTVRPHTGYIGEEFAGSSPPPYVLVQPDDRGTAAGILYAAHWIAWRDPEATVAIFPSDHFILGEATFMATSEVAARRATPRRVVLLGSASRRRVRLDRAGLAGRRPRGVVSSSQFWEKPSEARVQLCLTSGCVWNTAIVVGRADALIRLGALALPEMSARLAGIQRFLDSDEEGAALHQAYALMSRASFARAVLEPHPERLGVSRLPRVSWCDLGSPRRVLEVLARMRVRPAWADLPELPAAPASPRPRAGRRRPPRRPRRVDPLMPACFRDAAGLRAVPGRGLAAAARSQGLCGPRARDQSEGLADPDRNPKMQERLRGRDGREDRTRRSTTTSSTSYGRKRDFARTCRSPSVGRTRGPRSAVVVRGPAPRRQAPYHDFRLELTAAGRATKPKQPALGHRARNGKAARGGSSPRVLGASS
jgi:mannose-1-phosphate guanylyltransferase